MKSFGHAPFLVIWEVTRACDLACLHCRASAISLRHPLELTAAEGVGLLRHIRCFGSPLMVFTGGDPLKRPDLFYLLQKSVDLGLRTTVTPSATPLLTREAVAGFQGVGVARMALSLDGCDGPSHDDFRGVPGSFARTLEALEEARRIGLPTQVNTTVTRRNIEELGEIAAIVRGARARLWSVFFLVPTGRASAEDDLAAEEYEGVFAFLYELALTAPFDVKTTEAQHYRRFVAQQGKLRSRSLPNGPARSVARRPAINDGKGLAFVSHTGEIYPSGFLPVSAGNVRRDRLTDVYRFSPLFRRLRDAALLEGKCGLCEFRNLCGGSRARSYALTGNYLAEDPRCVYEPRRARLPA